jgi:hypothetical protein
LATPVPTPESELLADPPSVTIDPTGFMVGGVPTAPANLGPNFTSTGFITGYVAGNPCMAQLLKFDLTAYPQAMGGGPNPVTVDGAAGTWSVPFTVNLAAATTFWLMVGYSNQGTGESASDRLQVTITP